MNPIIQVAGIIDLEEAELLIKSGVDFLGFPLRLPVNKEDLKEEEVQKIIKKTHFKNFVLITYLSKATEIINFCNYLRTPIVQLHGEIEIQEIQILKSLAPKIKIIKSLVIKENNLEYLENLIHETYNLVDYYITDTFDPLTGASGATGKTHDWEISKQLVEVSPKPVILAGGLNPENVKEAIIFVKPAGVDVHTGVENCSGRKDKYLLKKFIKQARHGYDEVAKSQLFEIPIDGVLDLHLFKPSDVKALLPEYILECQKKCILNLRIIHGKGISTLKTIVHNELKKNTSVEKYRLASGSRADWGSTEVILKK